MLTTIWRGSRLAIRHYGNPKRHLSDVASISATDARKNSVSEPNREPFSTTTSIRAAKARLREVSSESDQQSQDDSFQSNPKRTATAASFGTSGIHSISTEDASSETPTASLREVSSGEAEQETIDSSSFSSAMTTLSGSPTAAETYLSLVPPSYDTEGEGSQSHPIGLFRHPFSTYRFVNRLESVGFDHATSETVMRATKALLMREEEEALGQLVGKTELENQAYLFSAALSELRTEVQVQARNDSIAQHSANALLQREVDSLTQKMREDMQTLKNDIALEINTRKDEFGADLKALELKTQEIGGKFTSLLGDVRTEVESVKLDTTRNFILMIMGLVVLVILFDPFKPPPPAPPTVTDLGIKPLPAEPELNWIERGTLKRVGEEEEE